MRIVERKGLRYGRLLVIGRAPKDSYGRVRWACLCDCGNRVDVISTNLDGRKSRPGTNSCGCIQSETAAIYCKKRTKHGMASHRLTRIWRGMHQRCRNPKAPNYKYYGAIGIKVCTAWFDSSTFFRWALANGYRNDLSLDRYPNPSGDYEPSNCRWATWVQQRNNRRIVA